MHHLTRFTLVTVFSLTTLAASILMIGPQLLIIVPAVWIVAVVLLYYRSFLSLVCFGYPLLFGFVSAAIGVMEIPGYESTQPFRISILLGAAGLILVVWGLWKGLPASLSSPSIVA